MTVKTFISKLDKQSKAELKKWAEVKTWAELEQKIAEDGDFRIVKCDGCDEWQVENGMGEAFAIGYGEGEELRHCNINDQRVCQGCLEAEYPSTLVKYSPEGKQVVIFDNFQASDKDQGEPNDWFWQLFTKRTYKKTDAWRGHYDTKLDGLKSIANGWITGMPDETTKRKLRLAELFDLLGGGELTPPCELFWLFEPTSNVFSTASEMLVRPEDTDTIIDWLKSEGFDQKELEDAFA